MNDHAPGDCTTYCGVCGCCEHHVNDRCPCWQSGYESDENFVDCGCWMEGADDRLAEERSHDE